MSTASSFDISSSRSGCWIAAILTPTESIKTATPSLFQMNFSCKISGAKMTDIIMVKHDVVEIISAPAYFTANALRIIVANCKKIPIPQMHVELFFWPSFINVNPKARAKDPNNERNTPSI